MSGHDLFGARITLTTQAGSHGVYRLGALSEAGIGHVDKLPYSIKILLESCLRNADGYVVTEDHVRALANYNATEPQPGPTNIMNLVIMRSRMGAGGGCAGRWCV